MKHRIFITDFPLETQLQSRDVVNWLIRLIGFYNVSLHRISYSFVSPERLLSINQNHLDHHDLTDIITFNFNTHEHIVADIYICAERWIENAGIYRQSNENELLRMFSHGFLHCLGYNDKSASEKIVMRNEEDRCIQMFHVKQDSYV